MATCNIDNNLITFSTDGKISCVNNLKLQNSTNTEYQWPTVDATANQVLSAGSTPGTMEWVDQSGGTTTTYEFLQAGINVVTAVPANATPVLFDTTLASNGGITRVLGVFSLEADKTYKLTGALRTNNTTTADITYQWRDITNNTLIGTIGSTTSYTSTSNFSVNSMAQAFLDTTAATTVHLEIVSGGGVGQFDAFNCLGTVETQIVGSGGGGGGTPGGTNRNVQFNENGSFGGDLEFVWDPTGTLTPLDPIKRLLVAEPGAVTTGKIDFVGTNPFLLDIRGSSAGTDPTFLNISSDIGTGISLTASNQDINTYLLSAQGGFINTLATTGGDLTIDAGTGPPILGPRQAANLKLSATSDIYFDFVDIGTNSVTSFIWPKTPPLQNDYFLSTGTLIGNEINLEWVPPPTTPSSGQTEGIIQLTDGSGGFTSNSGLIFETPAIGTERLVVSSLVSPDIPTAPYAPYNLNGDFLLDVRAFGRTFTSVSGGFLDSEEGYLVYGGGNFRAKFSYINVDSGNTRDDAVLESTNSLVLEWQYTEQAIVKEANHRLPNTTPTKDTNIISAGTSDVDSIRNCEWIDRDSSFGDAQSVDVEDRSAYIQLNGLTSDGGLIPEFTPNNEFSNRPNLRWDPAPGGSSADTVDRLLIATEDSNVTRFTPSGSTGVNQLTPFMLDIRNNILPTPPSVLNQGDCYINIGIIQEEKGGLLVTNQNNSTIASLLCNNGTTTLTSTASLVTQASSTTMNTGTCLIDTGSGTFTVDALSGGGINMSASLGINIVTQDSLLLESSLGTVVKSAGNVTIENSSGSYTWPTTAPTNEGESLLSGPTGTMQWSGFNQNVIKEMTVKSTIVRWVRTLVPVGFTAPYQNFQILSLNTRNRIFVLGGRTDTSGVNNAGYYSDDGGINWTNGRIGRIGSYQDLNGPSLTAYDPNLDRVAIVYGINRPNSGAPLYNAEAAYSIDGGENFIILGSSSVLSGYTDWKSLKFINNILVVVGLQDFSQTPPVNPAFPFTPSTICWSINGGQSWNKTFQTPDYLDIAYGDNKYVAVKSGGGASYAAIISSTWTEITTPATFTQIIYIDEVDKYFLATTEDFTLYRSTDGITWTLQEKILMQDPFVFTPIVNQLKYIPELTVFILTLSISSIYYYSFDGIIWFIVIESLLNIEYSSFLRGLISTQGTFNTTGAIKTNGPTGTLV